MQCSPLSYYHYTTYTLTLTGVAPQSCTKPSSTSLQNPPTPYPSHHLAAHQIDLTMASLAILLLLARISSSIATSSSYISRSAEQQVIATVSPATVLDIDGQSAQQPFLTSPSGSYAAYLRRAVGSGGGGLAAGDACYVQIIQQAGGASGSLWESDCTTVGGADTCELAFSPVGLELFAGGHSLWDTGVDAADDDAGTLSLDDGGDMRIVSREEGVTVWAASGEPWTGQQCGGAPLPPVSAAPSSTEALPPQTSAVSTKLVTPPAATTLAAGAGSTTDSSFGDQPALPPVGTFPDQPPVDTAPEQPLPLPPPPADVSSPDWPDQPLLAPPPADMLPDEPLYSSPPPAPAATTFGPQPPLLPPAFGVPFATPPTGDTIPGSPGSSVPFSGPSPVGMPQPHGHAHQLPLGGASPPLPDAALAPGVHGGAGAGQLPGAPFGHGGQQQGVFGQQPQLLNGGEGQPLEDSAADGWSRTRSESGRVAACMALLALVTLDFGF